MAIQRIQKSVEDIPRVQKVPLLFSARNRSGQFLNRLALESDLYALKGNVSRQEAVSMLPPLLLDVQPHHKVSARSTHTTLFPNLLTTYRSSTCARHRDPR
jgi:16S rRNA C967 or C1407 C5-methylase (RsmB/RsmF family)